MSLQTIEFTAEGMHCAACENYLETRMSKLHGVKKVNANLDSHKVLVEINSSESIEKLALDFTDLVKDNGYKITLQQGKKDWKKEGREFLIAGLISFGLLTIYLALENFNLIPRAGNGFSLNPITAFALGIVASLSTCSAVLGGVILSLSANTAKVSKRLAITSGISFHVSRVLTFLILGAFLGFLGLVVSKSGVFNQIEFTFWSNLVLSIVMIILAFNLLNLFNFNKIKLTMPKIFGTEITEQSEKSVGIWGGIGLGFLSFFLPCNFTQAMQLSAFTSGSVLNGSLLLLGFSLGTLPVLGLLTFASINFAKSFQNCIFYKTSGFLILIISIYTIYSLFLLRGLVY